MFITPHCCAEADCNVKASPTRAEIADNVIVIAIVTNASSRKQCVFLSVVLTSQSAFHRQTSQLFSLINRSSLWPYLSSDTGCSLHSPNCLQSRFIKLSTDALISM